MNREMSIATQLRIPVRTNLVVLRPPYRAPQAGDIFVFCPVGRDYFFGRVVRTGISLPSMKKGLLIYLFGIESHTKQPPERLSITGLLIPPVLTDTQAWLRGYFEIVKNRSFGPGERFERHCFREPRVVPPRYVDEEGNPLSERTPRCGIYARTSYLDLDDAISTALDIPRVRHFRG